MSILITRTYEIDTEESAELGEASERGFLGEDEPVTFRELVNLLKHGQPSNCPARGDVWEWVTQDQGETGAWFERGERESHAIHYSRKNAAHKARYWLLAFKAAGLTK